MKLDFGAIKTPEWLVWLIICFFLMFLSGSMAYLAAYVVEKHGFMIWCGAISLLTFIGTFVSGIMCGANIASDLELR